MFRFVSRGLLVVAILLTCRELTATTLLVNQEDTYPGPFGYGFGAWDNMSAALDAAFGAENITVSDAPLNDLESLLQFDRLWFSLPRSHAPGFTADQQANLKAFLATGRRAVLIGENNNWADWNRSILATVGGDYMGNLPSGVLTPVLDHPLTAGIRAVSHNIDGLASGGVPLFQFNVASLWGTQRNVLTLLSVSVISDDYGGDNLRFETNLAEWLAVPEPAATAWLLFGLFSTTRWRRNYS